MTGWTSPRWTSRRWAVRGPWIAAVVGLLSVARLLTGAETLTSSATSGAALRLTVPVLLAGLGGLVSERAGVVNIGLEGMMILGTWLGAWGGIHLGPWWGVALGIAGGALGGLLHAAVTVYFGVDHIVSGLAVNLLAAGIVRFGSAIAYEGHPGGGITQSPRVPGEIGKLTALFLAGGKVFGWRSPDLRGGLGRARIPFVSDGGDLAKGLVSHVSILAVLSVALVPVTASLSPRRGSDRPPPMGHISGRPSWSEWVRGQAIRTCTGRV